MSVLSVRAKPPQRTQIKVRLWRGVYLRTISSPRRFYAEILWGQSEGQKVRHFEVSHP